MDASRLRTAPGGLTLLGAATHPAMPPRWPLPGISLNMRDSARLKTTSLLYISYKQPWLTSLDLL